MTSVTNDGHVHFQFYRPHVSSVTVVGDFNNWNERDMTMTDDGNGWWSASVQFGSGDYRFRYLADGQWFIDFASFGVELNKTGYDSVLRVPEQFQPGTVQNKKAKQVA